ncbi:MAG: DNA mismatch repair endonuclease MutL [Bacteroidales bacterium]|jgi:DNA mismatch repair protein MutL|nr:DNA mismatch repair endonuclease MutL [Bacteroidales bacterium]
MLKILPENISNLIAAGEVVQRPASVVKELMENAVDAGSSQITLIISDSGRTLIQVIDNGCGMTKEEALLSFERHATSKISEAEDLYSIYTYGFRGEALASIASCSEVTLKTKKAPSQSDTSTEEETGTELRISAGKVTCCEEAACPQGCNFAVRNIFYNIPARRKFLKSDNVEYRNMVKEFEKIALTNINIEFKLINDSREIYHLLPAQNIKQRIFQMEGKSVTDNLLNIDTNTTVVNVTGFTGCPASARKYQANEYFFVNGRYFKNPLLYKALIKAYSSLITEGTTPPFFIYLTVDPKDIDVNIHPSKTEVKFENEQIIFEILNAAAKESIGANAFVPSIDFDNEGVPEIPSIPSDFYTKDGKINPSHFPQQPKIDYDPLFNPFEEEKSRQIAPNYAFDKEKARKDQVYVNNVMNDTGGNRPLLQIKGKYIITTVKSGIMLIDIKRAKQRILYDNYMNRITSADEPAIQEILYPQTVDVDRESFDILTESQEKLKQAGFDIRPFGKNTVIVYGVPAAFAGEQIFTEQCVYDIVDDLKEYGKDFAKDFKEHLVKSLIKSNMNLDGTNMGEIESLGLIDALFASKEPNISPFGEKCMEVITIDELAKFL